ncbi:RagB/SusD family nutrient uptake outer membrane protein [Ohtaekwangia sp.]|uniref:RagB/SusD family nutrient uptake outer membrane protein n=1 Tax=Ohtaekwangia sp. TaxID=2066019 RepID=UPI002FDE788D
MKRKIYKSYIAIATALALLTGCGDDFINQPPTDSIVDANFYKTDAQVLAASAPLYNAVWFAYNDKASHGIGDGRGGVLSANYSYQLENITFRTTGATAENYASWRAFYNVVGQSNVLINNLNKYAGADVTDGIKQHAIAEARFMRGLAYAYLVQNYGAVPVFTDNIAILQDTTVTRNTVESVWEFICRDIRYGTTHLPETPVAKGRLTKWAAEGMLAKMYLTRAGVGQSGSRNQTYLDSARVLAKDVIENSGASLMADYEELFKMKNNNNSETLFALQWVYNGDWGTQNSVQAFLAFSSSITGTADGWGGDLGASIYMLSKYEGLVQNGIFGSTPDKRRKASFMLPGDHYSYIHQQVLDNNGNSVIQELVVPTGASGYNTRAWIKKYVVGRAEDNDGKVLQQRTEIQTYMLRLADVYLVYAEAILGNNASTSDAEALKYFNMVRTRAGVPEKTSLTWDDIFNERHLEFAMEGQMWYDFVRLHYYDPQRAYDILSNQHRGFTRITPDDPDAATSWKIEPDPDYTGQTTFSVGDGNFNLPIPENELAKAPSLRREPVPYVFQ